MKLGIRAKLTISLLFMLVLSFLFSGSILISDSEKRLETFHHTQAKYQARTLAEASLDAIVSEDYELMERWVSSAMPSDVYAYAGLVKPNGKIITHTNLYLIGKTISTLNGNPEVNLRKVSYEGRPVMEAIHPLVIGKKHLANAHVAYYLDVPNDIGSETTARLIVILIVTSVVMLIGVALIINQYIDPLRQLTFCIAQFSIDKGIKIAPRIMGRKDEIGALANTFNELSYRLLNSYKDLKAKSHELEGKVIERTRKLTELNLQLQESESYINAIMENVVDAIATINTSGIIQSYNSSAEKLFGYTKEEAIGKNISLLMPEGEKIKHDDYIVNYLQSGKAGILGNGARELVAITKEGREFPMELLINELKREEGHIFIGTMRDITERKLAESNLRYAADHDALTKLYNRKYFEEELERVVERVRRGQSLHCALFYIDLDNFKYVNDNLGHAAGDKVLLDVTDIMKKRVRKSDLAARLGGDEFVVLIYDTSLEMAKAIADSFRNLVFNYKYKHDGTEVDVGCSIGVVMITEEYSTKEDVLADADSACYEAKAAGRNCVKVFSKSA